jgi:hypothetical protein
MNQQSTMMMINLPPRHDDVVSTTSDNDATTTTTTRKGARLLLSQDFEPRPFPIQHQFNTTNQQSIIMMMNLPPPRLTDHDVVSSTKSDEDEDTTKRKEGGAPRLLLLPKDFEPTPSSVIIGRAKTCKDAVGNQRLRVLAELHLPKYSGATCKVDKSTVVTDLVKAVRAGCPTGGAFIKFHNQRWWEVDNRKAREKVGYVLRDLLSDRYKSSSRSKTSRRKEEQYPLLGGG